MKRKRERKEWAAIHIKNPHPVKPKKVRASDLGPTPRQERGRVRGWTVAISPASHGSAARSLLRQRFPHYTRGDHEHAAQRFSEAAKRLGAAWGRRWDAAFNRTHGRKPQAWDYRVSGVGDDRLPEADKDALRGLALAQTRASYLADAHRAAGKNLRQAVRLPRPALREDAAAEREQGTAFEGRT